MYTNRPGLMQARAALEDEDSRLQPQVDSCLQPWKTRSPSVTTFGSNHHLRNSSPPPHPPGPPAGRPADPRPVGRPAPSFPGPRGGGKGQGARGASEVGGGGRPALARPCRPTTCRSGRPTAPRGRSWRSRTAAAG